MNLYVDIETTGLPQKNFNWEVDYMKYPYVLTIAWDFNGKEHYYIINQEGRKVPLDATKVNGITTKMANDPKLSTDADKVYRLLIVDACKAANIIGHNIYFDTSIIKANIIRKYGMDSDEVENIVEAFQKDKRQDTMRSMTRYFGKWPKLEELYEWLFKEEIKGAHNALNDVRATKRCHLELKKRKLL